MGNKIFCSQTPAEEMQEMQEQKRAESDKKHGQITAHDRIRMIAKNRQSIAAQWIDGFNFFVIPF